MGILSKLFGKKKDDKGRLEAIQRLCETLRRFERSKESGREKYEQFDKLFGNEKLQPKKIKETFAERIERESRESYNEYFQQQIARMIGKKLLFEHLKGIPELLRNEKVTVRFNQYGILINDTIKLPMDRIKKAQTTSRSSGRWSLIDVISIAYVNSKEKQIVIELKDILQEKEVGPVHREALVKFINDFARYPKDTKPYEL